MIPFSSQELVIIKYLIVFQNNYLHSEIFGRLFFASVNSVDSFIDVYELKLP